MTDLVTIPAGTPREAAETDLRKLVVLAGLTVEQVRPATAADAIALDRLRQAAIVGRRAVEVLAR